MAFNREMSITVNAESGTLNFTGQIAQQIVLEFERFKNGGLPKSMTAVDATGERREILFSCLCGITVNPQTEAQIPDAPCEQLDCLG